MKRNEFFHNRRLKVRFVSQNVVRGLPDQILSPSINGLIRGNGTSDGITFRLLCFRFDMLRLNQETSCLFELKFDFQKPFIHLLISRQFSFPIQ